ncbi:MAG TPA: sulfatase-like hydrolase/transferase [Candidatus Binataceae bacterium]|nr:sulfatase-like hydrolase/transferase [Candidatus Binataceae bacterium]
MASSASRCGQGSSSKSPFDQRLNILILMTDEQRAVQHWPESWANDNLKSLDRLRQHGLNFTSAFTNTCQCSPSRATFLTSTYAPVNRTTMTDGTLNPALPNLAQILSKAGYNVVYKGKWHLNINYLLPFAVTNSEQLTAALQNNQALQDSYGFSGWNSPDAGTTAGGSIADLQTLGGGVGGNDARFVGGSIPGEDTTNVLQFLDRYDSPDPFCLIVSLVNPHDIFVYPAAKLFGISGYEIPAFNKLPIELPPTYGEDLSTKPTVQASFVNALNAVWPFTPESPPLLYARLYAYLTRLADIQLMRILGMLDAKGLTEDTLIVRVADHGELGLSHGGLRQKDYTAYEEMIRIPMIFSNPRLFPHPVETNCLAGLIDILPTLITVAGLDRERERWALQGRDLTALFTHPERPLQDRILFTYDDQFLSPQGAGHIRCIRKKDWKFALYFDPNGIFPTEYEMYDLANDPLERFNLAHGEIPDRYRLQRARLQAELNQLMKDTGTLPSQYVPPGSGHRQS